MNELSKIVGRDFVIGFFVPSMVGVGATIAVLRFYGILPDFLTVDPKDPLKDSTFIALITILVAFF
jgi:hypothetical protein